MKNSEFQKDNVYTRQILFEKYEPEKNFIKDNFGTIESYKKWLEKGKNSLLMRAGFKPS